MSNLELDTATLDKIFCRNRCFMPYLFFLQEIKQD